jgi:septum formation protein
MFKTLQPLILASESPRRQLLLRSVGIEFEVFPSRIDESIRLEAGVHKPAEIAEKWAGLKADSVSRLYPDQWVLGADTIVVLNGVIFGKPSNAAEAVRMLDMLSGRSHDVITGVCLIGPGGKFRRIGTVTTLVRFKALSTKEIEGYVKTGEPMDKAGGYGIQGIGAFLVRSVEGSYTNVVGLPLCETLDWLMDEKIIEPV